MPIGMNSNKNHWEFDGMIKLISKFEVLELNWLKNFCYQTNINFKILGLKRLFTLY